MQVILLVCIPLALLGCQGGYPIAPTPCDHWCEAIKERDCIFYDPAACVAECERQGMASRPECTEAFEEALACFQEAEIPCDESDPYFYNPGPWPCQQEEQALFSCVYS